jgi:hypothetical protein
MKTLYEKIVESEDLDKVFTPFTAKEVRERVLKEILEYLGNDHIFEDSVDYWIEDKFQVHDQHMINWIVRELRKRDRIIRRSPELIKIEQYKKPGTSH